MFMKTESRKHIESIVRTAQKRVETNKALQRESGRACRRKELDCRCRYVLSQKTIRA